MPVSQKCQYALRAVFDLAKNNGETPVKMAQIAKRQAIPLRFLEIILNELKRGGFIKAIRGRDGGCILARSPVDLRVGEIVRFIEGSLAPVGCVNDGSKESCPLYGNCVFFPLWERVQKSLSDVYDGTTFQDLIDQETRMMKQYETCPDYVI